MKNWKKIPSPYLESDKYGDIGTVPIIGEIETVPKSLESILDEMEILGIVGSLETTASLKYGYRKNLTVI